MATNPPVSTVAKWVGLIQRQAVLPFPQVSAWRVSVLFTGTIYIYLTTMGSSSSYTWKSFYHAKRNRLMKKPLSFSIEPPYSNKSSPTLFGQVTNDGLVQWILGMIFTHPRTMTTVITFLVVRPERNEQTVRHQWHKWCYKTTAT